jgi:hypothetical protein
MRGMGMTFATSGNVFNGTFTGKLAAVDVLSVWRMLEKGVGTGLIDFSGVTEHLNRDQLDSVVRQAREIPPSRLAFVCGNSDMAFGSLRMLLSRCGVRAEHDVFRRREMALMWLDSPGEVTPPW